MICTVLLGCLVAVGACDASAHAPRTATAVTHRPAVERRVVFEGVSVDLPQGWRTARPGCGPLADQTVVRGTWSGSCPGMTGPSTPTTAMRLTSLYGRQFALSWPGRRGSWHGQPAWLGHRTDHGLTTYSLALPWLNAVVWAQSGDAAAARRLLSRVHQRRLRGLAVPQQARSVFIQSFAGRDGDGVRRNVTLRRTHDLARVLADLRSLRVVDGHGACDGSWWPRTATLTVRAPAGSRTYAARFDACGQVVGGTGAAAVTSERLLRDIRRFVPDSGL